MAIKMTQVHIRLPDDIVRRIDDAAETLGTTRNGLITAAAQHMLPAMEKGADEVLGQRKEKMVIEPTTAGMDPPKEWGPLEVEDLGPAEEVQQITPEEVRKPEGERHWHRYDLRKPIPGTSHYERGERYATFECQSLDCAATKTDKVHPDVEEDDPWG